MFVRTAYTIAIALAFTLGVAPAGATDIPPYIAAALADSSRPATDVARDADRKPAETLAFVGVKPGDRVLELLPESGYYTRILSKVVGPTGNVYAFTPQEILGHFSTSADASRAIAADHQYSNVTVLVMPMNGTYPHSLDVVWTTQNYHDLHLPKFFPNLDIRDYNRAMLAALRRGGVFLVNDHEAEPGSGLRDINLHRIDAEIVRSEATAAGFTFDGESDILRNPSDPHTANVFDKAIRGHTDQFVFRFRKPMR